MKRARRWPDSDHRVLVHQTADSQSGPVQRASRRRVGACEDALARAGGRQDSRERHRPRPHSDRADRRARLGSQPRRPASRSTKSGRRSAASVPLGRIGRPEELANLVVLPRLGRCQLHHRSGDYRRWWSRHGTVDSHLSSMIVSPMARITSRIRLAFAKSFRAFARASCTRARTSQSWVEIDEGATFPEHHHPHEQVVNVLEGVLELTVNGEVFAARTWRRLRHSARRPAFGSGADGVSSARCVRARARGLSLKAMVVLAAPFFGT